MSRRILVLMGFIITFGIVGVSACDQGEPSAEILSVEEISESRASAPGPVGISPNVRFVGNIHDVAMRDLVTNLDHWVQGEGSRQARACAAAVRLTAKYIPLVDQEMGITRSPAAILAKARQAVSYAATCRPQPGQSVFGEAMRAPVDMSATLEDSLVSGAFVPYTDELVVRFEATNGTVSQITAVANDVLQSASGLPYADYQVVAAMADLAISSATAWNDQDWGPSGDYCVSGSDDYCALSGSGGGTRDRDPMYVQSIFLDVGWLRKALVAGAADVAGAATMAAANWWQAGGGPVGWGLLTGEVAIVGVGTSAVTAIGFLAE